MNDADIESGLRYHAALEEVFSKTTGGCAASHSVRQVQRLCFRASLAVKDNYCREQLDLIEPYAVDLFSEGAHQRWQRGRVGGVEVLQNKIRKCLGTFEARLISIAHERDIGEHAKSREVN